MNEPNNNSGAPGSSDYGVLGINKNGNLGKIGISSAGVWGSHLSSGNQGYLGRSVYGVEGIHSNDNLGGLGHKNYGVWCLNKDGHFGGFGSIWAM